MVMMISTVTTYVCMCDHYTDSNCTELFAQIFIVYMYGTDLMQVRTRKFESSTRTRE